MSRTRKGKGFGEAGKPYAGPKRALNRLASWKLEDAKARFSELVRRARSEGPQRVTLRGQDAVVVISAEDFAKLAPGRDRRGTLVDFLRTTALGDVNIEREPDRGRDLVL